MSAKCQIRVASVQEQPSGWWTPRFRLALILMAAVLACGAFVYFPALNGEFVFDDLSLPLTSGPGHHPLASWMSGTRPILILSYGLNGLLLGEGPLSYHLINLLIHAVNTCLVFLVLGRLLAMAGWLDKRKTAAAAGIGSLVFLIHPLQTESVSYISGRSESLASMFLLLAYIIFLYRERDSITWGRALAVMVLFGLGVKTKENAVSLAGILLLTDITWPRPFSMEGPRKNWRLYALMLPGAIVAAIGIFRSLSTAATAGFGVTNFTWYQYGLTEARAIFKYLQLAVLPVGQALDHDFPTSHTLTQYGALVYIVALAGLVAAAIHWRRGYPLSCFGFLMFLGWLAPTSSIIPVSDALVERRMYLALIGLILIACDVVERLKPSRPVLWGLTTVIALTFGGFCYARNQLWGKPELLIALAAQDATYNPRPLLNVAELLMKHNRCDLAVPYLERADRIVPRNYFVNAGWGRALACLGRTEEGIQHLQFAAQIQPCSQIYLWMGLAYGQMGRSPEAGAALQEAVRRDPGSGAAHGALALWYESIRDFSAAEREYAANVYLDPEDTTARLALARVSRLKSAQPPPENLR